MRKPIAIILSLMLLALFAAPAAAAPAFSLKVDDAVYDGEFNVIEGTTMIPLDYASSLIKAESSVENNQIKIEKGNSLMLLTLDSTKAELDKVPKVMPQAPSAKQDIYMVPLRFVMENFGAEVGWNADTYEISVKTSPSNISAAETALAKISQAMLDANSYKMKADTSMIMDMTMGEEAMKMSMSGQINASVQQEPMLLVMDTSMKIDEMTGVEEEIPAEMLTTQMVMNEEGYFMTMPGQEGWLKLDMEGINFNKLMEQYGSQDPVQSIMQMKKFGAVVTPKADQIIENKNYGVINIVMGKEVFANYLNDIFGQTGMLGLNMGAEETAELEAMMNDLMKSINADISYDIVFDKDTFLPYNMTLDSAMDMKMTIPADEATDTPAAEMMMKMDQQAAYQMYDFGIAFPVPIIEDYKTMEELLAELTPAEEIPAE